MKTKALFLLVLPALLVLTSCTNSVEEDVVSQPDPNPNPVVKISFATQVKPIIDNNCTSCHNGSQFPDLRTYSGIKASASSVSARVANKSMPIGGSLSQQEIDIIVNWVKEGANNN